MQVVLVGLRGKGEALNFRHLKVNVPVFYDISHMETQYILNK